MENVDAERNSTQITDPSLAKGNAGYSDSAPVKSSEGAPEKKSSQRDTLQANFNKGTKKEVKADKSDVGTSLEKKAAPVAEKTADAPAPVQRELIAAPGDMNAEERAAFANPTPENAHILQKYASRRGMEMRNDYGLKSREIGQQRAQVQEVLDAVGPLQKEYSNVGLGKLIENTTQWDKALKSESKMPASMEFLNAYGISEENLREYLDSRSGEIQQPAQNANYLTREDAEKLADERVQRQFELHNQTLVAKQNHSVVLDFMKGKPLFRDPGTAQQLEQDMAPVVQSLRSQHPGKPTTEILDLAYNYVTKGNPSYSGLVSQLDAKTDAERENEKAEKAIRASRSISGSPGSGTPKQRYKNQRENLRANFYK